MLFDFFINGFCVLKKSPILPTTFLITLTHKNYKKTINNLSNKSAKNKVNTT
jgi:hypothetical protein